MTVIGNILWFLFGGLIGGLAWVLAGCLWCVTIIGIPVGLQCFKFASLAFFPFGKEVIYGGGGFSFLVNLIWIVFFGLEMAIGYVILGCLWCITLLGIPIGKQCFKMAKRDRTGSTVSLALSATPCYNTSTKFVTWGFQGV